MLANSVTGQIICKNIYVECSCSNVTTIYLLCVGKFAIDSLDSVCTILTSNCQVGNIKLWLNWRSRSGPPICSFHWGDHHTPFKTTHNINELRSIKLPITQNITATNENQCWFSTNHVCTLQYNSGIVCFQTPQSQATQEIKTCCWLFTPNST